ncbi:Tegument protein UL47-like protein [Bienertia sinuspersici]
MYVENLPTSACSWTNMEGSAYALMKLFGRGFWRITIKRELNDL